MEIFEHPRPLFPPLSILFRPLRTLRHLVGEGQTRTVLVLASVSASFEILGIAVDEAMGADGSYSTVLMVAFVGGPLLGLPSLYLMSWLLRFTGSFFGGGATAEQLRICSAWATVPSLIVALLWMPVVFLSGGDVFLTEAEFRSAHSGLADYASWMGMLGWVAMIWSWIVLLIGIAEVQGFNFVQAFFNNLMASVLFYLTILTVSMVLVTVIGR